MSNDDIKYFVKLASKYGVLPKDEEKELIKRAQAKPKDLKAWDKLIRHNLKWVIKIASKYLNQGLSFEDLIQEGLCGLVIAIEKFDISRGALSTYATWWIKQAITRAIDNTGRGVRIPIHRLNEYRMVRRVYREFVERWGTTPNSEELSILITKAAEIDPKKRIKALSKPDVELLGRMMHPQVSLDAPETEDENLTMMDYLASDPDQQPEAVCEIEDNKRKLLDLLGHLPEEERIFVMIKFGLIDGKERDRKEMATYRRMSEQEVQRRLDNILGKLRSMATRDDFSLD